MIYSCMGMVWGVDWIHLVWVGVSIKKPGGVTGYGKNAYLYYFSDSEGSRSRAQKLGEMKVERKVLHIRVWRWCEELIDYTWFDWGLV